MYDTIVDYTSEYLGEMTSEELKQLGQQARATRLALETNKAQAGGWAQRPHLFKKVRRDIARIETAMRKVRR